MANDLHTEMQPAILVVEDETLVRQYAVELLEDAGFEVIEAHDANAALKIVRSRSGLRVLFTDIEMPGPVSGMELARKVHESWPDILVLVTSGGRKPPQMEISDHGRFLAKPYTRKRLLEEIDRLGRDADARLAARSE